jgi:hypothetical protein
MKEKKCETFNGKRSMLIKRTQNWTVSSTKKKRKHKKWMERKVLKKKHYYEMHPSSLWVSLDFEWIWTFLLNEIVLPPNERGSIAKNNDLFH